MSDTETKPSVKWTGGRNGPVEGLGSDGSTWSITKMKDVFVLRQRKSIAGLFPKEADAKAAAERYVADVVAGRRIRGAL